MSEYDTPDFESTDLEPRTERALSECMTVLPEGGDVYTVVGENGGTYSVDGREGVCSCDDFTYREPAGGCKHIRRVALATGERPVPADVDADPHLGEHTDATPRVAATDGGIIEAPDDGELLDERDEGDDGNGRTYTYHWEPYSQGGERFVRCESCGAECIPANPERLSHFEGCPEGRD